MTDKQFFELLDEYDLKIKGDKLQGSTTNFIRLIKDRLNQLDILHPSIDALREESPKH